MLPRKSLFALAKALEGLPVLGTLEGTPAARAGIRYGDVLISVNGMRTRSVADYVEAKNLRVDGMEVVVFRGGSESKTDLEYEDPARSLDGKRAGHRQAVLADRIPLAGSSLGAMLSPRRGT